MGASMYRSDWIRDEASARQVRAWLIVVAVLIAGIILIGGATRLTDSGLSITSWQPLTGVLPPLSEDAWLDLFIRYQGIPEFQIVNQGMTIDEFKVIYWWEWTHRNYGRFIGLVFFIPFAWFLLRHKIRGGLAGRLGGILALGALQGFIGWYMVQSGLEEGVDVSPYRLAIHLAVPFVILGALIWTMRDFSSPPPDGDKRAAMPRGAAMILLVMVFIQIVAGALVAGLRAGHAYNTWPLMDGALIPDGLFQAVPWYLNPFENLLTVQFDHRMLAYALIAVVVWHASAMSRRFAGSPAAGSALLVAVLIALQAALGIITLVSMVPIALGLAHQAGAIIVFAASVRHLHIVTHATAANEAGDQTLASA